MAFGLDDLIGAGVGLVGNLISGGQNQDAAMARQDSANAFSAQQYATRYQTTVKDMEAAGLNPMLAYSQGVGSSPSGAVSNASPYGDLGSSVNQSRVATAQVANVEADTENKKAQADLIAAQAAQAWSSAGQADANTGLINETVNKVKAEVEKLKGDTNFASQQEILRNTAWSVYQQGALAQERGISEGQSRAMMQATIAKIISETKLNNLDIDAATALDNIGRSASQLKPVLDIFRTLMRK